MKITGTEKLKGLYLVVDMTINENQLLPIVEKALEGGVGILQLWAGEDIDRLRRMGKSLVDMAHRRGGLCLVADNIEAAQYIGANGVHFDGYEIPAITPPEVRDRLGGSAIIGVTCGNDVEKLRWAGRSGVDYVSFCSMFPSSSVDSCEIVPLTMVAKAKAMLTIPVFASGGITLENVDQVLAAGADGIAVVSAILKAPDTRAMAEAFQKKILDHTSVHKAH